MRGLYIVAIVIFNSEKYGIVITCRYVLENKIFCARGVGVSQKILRILVNNCQCLSWNLASFHFMR